MCDGREKAVFSILEARLAQVAEGGRVSESKQHKACFDASVQ